MKLLYLAPRNLGVHWKPAIEWRAAYAQFAIFFPKRVPTTTIRWRSISMDRSHTLNLTLSGGSIDLPALGPAAPESVTPPVRPPRHDAGPCKRLSGQQFRMLDQADDLKLSHTAYSPFGDHALSSVHAVLEPSGRRGEDPPVSQLVAPRAVSAASGRLLVYRNCSHGGSAASRRPFPTIRVDDTSLSRKACKRS